MHEMSLSEGMIRLIREQAGRDGFSRVKTVWLELGDLSHADPEAMRFCFDAVTKGTLAEGAQLEIVRKPGLAWCMDCAAQVRLDRRHDPCPQCNGYKRQVVEGDEMRLLELEVS